MPLNSSDKITVPMSNRRRSTSASPSLQLIKNSIKTMRFLSFKQSFRLMIYFIVSFSPSPPLPTLFSPPPLSRTQQRYIDPFLSSSPNQILSTLLLGVSINIISCAFNRLKSPNRLRSSRWYLRRRILTPEDELWHWRWYRMHLKMVTTTEFCSESKFTFGRKRAASRGA